MDTRYQTKLWMSAIALVLAIGQGCSSGSVGYTVDSEGGGRGMGEDEVLMGSTDQAGSPVNGIGEYAEGRSFNESGESYDPGAMGFSRAYNHEGTPDGMDIKNGGYNHNGLQYFEPGSGPNGAMSEYGHNYAGVPGYGSNNGPVSGFGSGYADSMNPGPEAWAEAFLRGNGSAGEDMSGGTVHSSQGYIRDGNGGLVPEHIDQDVLVAKANPYNSSSDNGHSDGHSMQRTRGSLMNGGHMGEEGEVKDVYFAFDSWKISQEGAYSLQADAEWLKSNPGERVTIEGHCDERGTQDYNMVLGKKRAEAARAYLVDLGVNSSQLKVVSYGKERPFCSEQNEHCYQQNRRGHMAVRSN